jgi:hypothetical protein
MNEFFDSVRKGVKKGVANVSLKAKSMLALTELNSRLHGLETERRAALEELGSVVYTLHVRGVGDPERVEARCALVANVDARIRETRAEIQRIETAEAQAAGAVSPSGVCECGTPVSAVMKFCGRCGRRLIERS